MLSKEFVMSYAAKTPPWGEVGYVTYKRTYARAIGNRTEEWFETIERCINGLLDIGAHFDEGEEEKLYDHVFNLRCNFSGRALWQLGTKTVERVGADSLQNCWHVAVDSPSAFTFAFNELMLGGGVGFNVQPEFVYNLPRVSETTPITLVDNFDCDFIVPDNREGWVKLLAKTLNAYFYSGKGFTYNVQCIRGRGEKIKAFGGIASGPIDLIQGIDSIISILQMNVGEKLKPIDCLDIMNIVGGIVVSGNVRRAAELGLGEANDLDFLKAKRWDLRENIPTHRTMSNNSIVTSSTENLPDEFWETYEVGGEPYGLVNLKLCKSHGRLHDGDNYRLDPQVVGVNPCAEVTLGSYESCNLSEIYLPNIEDQAQFAEVAGLLYKVCKAIACVKFSDPRTNTIVRQNRRIGIGVTGYFASKFVNDAGIFEYVYRHIEELDRIYSKEYGINESIKLTTVKPSGTLSLLPKNITPGAHPAYAEYMIRRIRMASNHPLVDTCRAHGYVVEPEMNSNGTANANTVVIAFPVHMEDAIYANEILPIEQLEAQLFLQEYWSDNSVSVTVYYKKEDLPEIRQWLKENYTERVKAVSFLLHSEHGFVQAPLEEITREQYIEMTENVIPIERSTINTLMDVQPDCETGACPTR